MSPLLTSWLFPAPRRPLPRPTRALELECLEDRAVPSVVAARPPSDPAPRVNMDRYPASNPPQRAAPAPSGDFRTVEVAPRAATIPVAVTRETTATDWVGVVVRAGEPLVTVGAEASYRPDEADEGGEWPAATANGTGLLATRDGGIGLEVFTQLDMLYPVDVALLVPRGPALCAGRADEGQAAVARFELLLGQSEQDAPAGERGGLSAAPRAPADRDAAMPALDGFVPGIEAAPSPDFLRAIDRAFDTLRQWWGNSGSATSGAGAFTATGAAILAVGLVRIHPENPASDNKRVREALRAGWDTDEGPAA